MELRWGHVGCSSCSVLSRSAWLLVEQAHHEELLVLELGSGRHGRRLATGHEVLVQIELLGCRLQLGRQLWIELWIVAYLRHRCLVLLVWHDIVELLALLVWSSSEAGGGLHATQCWFPACRQLHSCVPEL